MAYRISVDTGGTFTDVVVADETGVLLTEKALTTPDRIFSGMRAAMEAAAAGLDMGLDELLGQTTILIYGTTRAANAIVQNTVAKTALVTTEGFRDILVFREGGKYHPHDFSIDYPEPYIPRRYTFEVSERISSEAEVRIPLDVASATEIIERLNAQNFEAVAVCFLWSNVNPVHELAMADLIEKHLPDVPYTLSHKLIPIIREYRRASATAIDASLKPLMQSHLREMNQDLRAAGYQGEVLISTSVGGCMHVEALAERPIHSIKSGPAMAPVAGRACAEVEDLADDVVICDTGGTTFDVGLVRDGRLVFTRDTWLGGQWTGHIISMSSVDVRSIGAGGGSIAWIDSGGLLRVGPQSAGADPGPACYGRGGDEPTVTDAALVLGYLDPDYFLGGRMKLDTVAARRVVTGVAENLDQSVEQAAFSIMTLANEHMIKAIQEITINQGINPQESTLVAGGGAAGLSIMPIARELGCESIVLPRTAGALSAWGMQLSDIVAEHSVSRLTITNDFDYDGVNGVLQSIEDELMRFKTTLEGRGLESFELELFVEARYLYQVWELDVALPSRRFRSVADVDKLIAAFHAVHERVFAVVDEGNPVECLNWKGRITVHLSRAQGDRVGEPEAAGEPPVHSRREAFFGEGGTTEVPIYLGAAFAPGSRVQGPAIVEEPTTTIVVYPGMSARLSGAGNFLLTIRGTDDETGAE